jgi:hypothetical protein
MFQRTKQNPTQLDISKAITARSIGATQQLNAALEAQEAKVAAEAAEKDRLEREQRELAIFDQLPDPTREELGDAEYLRRCRIIEDDFRSRWNLTHPKRKAAPGKEEFELWKIKAGLRSARHV